MNSHIYFHGVALKHGKRVPLLGWNVKNQELYTVKPAYNGTAWNKLFRIPGCFRLIQVLGLGAMFSIFSRM